jgi:NAD(P)H-dependent flavin oxidoreductase YrpB (nitropropane dioxygenase family)
MRATPICHRLGITLPIFAFSDSPDVVAAVSAAGGFGVLGAILFDANELNSVLSDLDRRLEGRPYGVDIVIPATYEGRGDAASPTFEEVAARIPAKHREFTERLLSSKGIPPRPVDAPIPDVKAVGLDVEKTAQAHLEVALSHKCSMIVNALGAPPRSIVDAVHERGMLMGGLVGARQHVERQLDHRVDVIIAQGTEAGGHCGDIATVVLVPEVVDAVTALGSRATVLAAGGIGSGRQMAAALALGAQGVWMGSAWLATTESRSQIDDASLANLLAAGSGDTVRSRSMSGKPMRQLRTDWTEAWDGPSSPGCLGAPMQGLIHHGLAAPRIRALGVRELAGWPAGQVIGRFDHLQSVGSLISAMVEECDAAIDALASRGYADIGAQRR